jgi:ABC-type uncharacterized transport system permease subunit
MIESNFEYTEKLINNINTASIKKYNLGIEIAMFIILLGAVVLFVTSNTLIGVICSAIFIMLLISLVFANLSITKSNRVLVGQRVNIIFNEDNMVMTSKLGEKVLYKANFEYKAIKKVKDNQDLVFVYFDKVSVIIIPKTSFKTSKECKKAMELIGNNYVI